MGIDYSMAIDMWSFGCILAEMFTGYPIFPGENEQDQLACMMQVLGVPPKALVDRGKRKKNFFEEGTDAPKIVANSKGYKRRPGSKTLSGTLRCTHEPFVDFLARCLEWIPERRLTPAEALRHPYMSEMKQSAAAEYWNASNANNSNKRKAPGTTGGTAVAMPLPPITQPVMMGDLGHALTNNTHKSRSNGSLNKANQSFRD